MKQNLEPGTEEVFTGPERGKEVMIEAETEVGANGIKESETVTGLMTKAGI